MELAATASGLMAPAPATHNGAMPHSPSARSARPLARLRRLAAPAAVAAGGLAGSAARAGLATAFPSVPAAFPTVTLAVNLGGSLLLGYYLARRQRSVAARWTLPFWAIGVLGSFTTFSAFSVEVVRLLDAGAAWPAAGYVAASTLGGLAAVVLGQRLGRVGR